MTSIIPFEYEGQPVRTVMLDDETWFIAADVCKILDIENTSDALRSLDEDERRNLPRSEALDSGYPFADLRIQSLALVSEPGLYSLVLRSRKPEAKTFKRWVTHEVLPQIRKTGSYVVEKLTRRQLAEMIIQEADRADTAEARVAELEPMAAIAEAIANVDRTWSAAEAAKLLSGDPAIRMGRDRMLELLYQWGWIYRMEGRWTPKQPQVENGRLTIKVYPERWSESRQEIMEWQPQVRLTWKGLMEAHRRLAGVVPLQQLVDDQRQNGSRLASV